MWSANPKLGVGRPILTVANFNQLTSENQVQAVITTPSRELAYQIHTAAEQLAAKPHLKSVSGITLGTDKQRKSTSAALPTTTDYWDTRPGLEFNPIPSLGCAHYAAIRCR